MSGRGGGSRSNGNEFEPEPPRLRRFGCFALSSYWRTTSWPGLLLNRQFLLARLRRAFLQDSPTSVALARSPGANSFTPPACKQKPGRATRTLAPG